MLKKHYCGNPINRETKCGTEGKRITSEKSLVTCKRCLHLLRADVVRAPIMVARHYAPKSECNLAVATRLARAIVDDNQTGLPGTLIEWASTGFYVLTGWS